MKTLEKTLGSFTSLFKIEELMQLAHKKAEDLGREALMIAQRTRTTTSPLAL